MMVVTMTTTDRIEIDPDVARGRAVIRGTRIPVVKNLVNSNIASWETGHATRD
jgi:uncharacterized protein (DUF433 family)